MGDDTTPAKLPCPSLDQRWVHAGSQHLDLPIAPVTVSSTSYKAFTVDESTRIEQQWQSMSPEERHKAIQEWGRSEGEGAPTVKATPKKGQEKERRASNASGRSAHDVEVLRSGEEQPHDEVDRDGRYKDIMLQAQKEYENLDLISGVPVSQDSLFEVSLQTLSLHPTFWTHTGARVSVIRGSWFMTDSTKPCSWEFAEELERGYREIEPWQPSYKDELAAAISLGAAAEEKLRFNLPPKFGQLAVIFEDAEKARLINLASYSYLPRPFFRKGGGTILYRGFNAAAGAKVGSTSHSRRGSSNSTRPDTIVDDTAQKLGKVAEKVQEHASNQSALDEETMPVVDSDETDSPCTDLVLVIHGIGQQLAVQYEAYNFVYAGNQLRQVMRKQASHPALASIIRDRRVQVLPVQWRTLLQMDPEQSEEDHEHSMDNRFSMADITLNKSIPYVRELTNSVLLDIPLFMSHHRSKMIDSVCLQANKLYRLWIARHPDFEKYGRVHIIGHSLGSALAAHILSNQPTKMPSLAQLPRQVITGTRDRFLFNTSSLFLCGSPLGIFLHLEQAQIMPRKGRERTMNSPTDEALDRSGRLGCMSIDSLYNVFYPTDPIAYMLNAAVDAKLAAKRQPLAITSVTAPFFSAVSDSFGTISRYLPAFVSGGATDKKPVRPGAIRLPSGIEMTGPNGQERLEGSRGERRFSALNPHGNIDFYLPAAGPSEYLDMITSHASYWSDPSFAAFLLAEIFASKLDQFRTGMGLAQVPEA